MNALSWLKEYAARSQTADALENVKKQARADASNTFQTLIQQDQEREQLAATFAGREDLERIQQEGLTDRETIQSRDKALAAAAAFEEHKRSQENTDITAARQLIDQDAIRAFAKAQGISPAITESLVLNATTVAGNKAEPIDREEGAILTSLRGANTPEAVKAAIELIPERLKNKPSVTVTIAAALQNAAAAAAERADVKKKRWTKDPPTVKEDFTDPEYLAASRRLDALKNNLKGVAENPDDPDFTPEYVAGLKDEVAYLEEITKRHRARKLSTGRAGGTGDAFAAAVMKALGGSGKP